MTKATNVAHVYWEKLSRSGVPELTMTTAVRAEEERGGGGMGQAKIRPVSSVGGRRES
jgi:hypothetical protein